MKQKQKGLDIEQVASIFNSSDLDCIRYIKRNSEDAEIKVTAASLERANLYYIEQDESFADCVSQYASESDYTDAYYSMLEQIGLSFYVNGEAYYKNDEVTI